MARTFDNSIYLSENQSLEEVFTENGNIYAVILEKSEAENSTKILLNSYDAAGKLFDTSQVFYANNTGTTLVEIGSPYPDDYLAGYIGYYGSGPALMVANYTGSSWRLDTSTIHLDGMGVTETNSDFSDIHNGTFFGQDHIARGNGWFYTYTSGGVGGQLYFLSDQKDEPVAIGGPAVEVATAALSYYRGNFTHDYSYYYYAIYEQSGEVDNNALKYVIVKDGKTAGTAQLLPVASFAGHEINRMSVDAYNGGLILFRQVEVNSANKTVVDFFSKENDGSLSADGAFDLGAASISTLIVNDKGDRAFIVYSGDDGRVHYREIKDDGDARSLGADKSFAVSGSIDTLEAVITLDNRLLIVVNENVRTIDISTDAFVDHKVRDGESISGTDKSDSFVVDNYQDISRVYGNGGNDTFTISPSALAFVDGGTGTNTVKFSGSYAVTASNTGYWFDDGVSGTFENIQNLVGTGGDDYLRGNLNVAITLNGAAGNDVLKSGAASKATLIGGAGSDMLIGAQTSVDTASYQTATKGVIANLAMPSINTGDATGDIYSSIENLIGSGYQDHLYGNSFANLISAGDGNDTLVGGAGADKLYGGNGIDTAWYTGATKGVIANLTNSSLNTNDAKGDTYSSIENLTGTAYSDNLIGNGATNRLSAGAGNDMLDGADGNDTLIGGSGADKLIGGNGTDTASYGGASKGVAASLAATSINTNDAKGDTYSSIENLSGSSYNDSLTGNSASNTLAGGNGDDRLYGGLGKDLLIGGSGKDIFVFNSKPGSTNIDTVDDFIVADDTIWLDDDIFTQLGKVGDLSTAAFYAGAKAHDTSDRIIYDNTTGKLWYDADGTGTEIAIQFAVLDKGLTLTAADFDVIA